MPSEKAAARPRRAESIAWGRARLGERHPAIFLVEEMDHGSGTNRTWDHDELETAAWTVDRSVGTWTETTPFRKFVEALYE